MVPQLRTNHPAVVGGFGQNSLLFRPGIVRDAEAKVSIIFKWSSNCKSQSVRLVPVASRPATLRGVWFYEVRKYNSHLHLRGAERF
jgi:hypothetical protein